MIFCAEDPDRVSARAGRTGTGDFSIRFAAEVVKDASDLHTSPSMDPVFTLSGNPLPWTLEDSALQAYLTTSDKLMDSWRSD